MKRKNGMEKKKRGKIEENLNHNHKHKKRKKKKDFPPFFFKKLFFQFDEKSELRLFF